MSVGLFVAAHRMLNAGFHARPEMLPSDGLQELITSPWPAPRPLTW